MILFREIDIKLCQIYTKIFIYKILNENSRFKQIIFSKYTTNLKTAISQRSLRNLDLPLSLFKFDILKWIISIKNKNLLNSNNNRSKPKFIRLLRDIVVFRWVAYLLNMICLNLRFLHKILCIWIFV